MVPSFAKPFTYQVNWRSRSYHTGYHRGAQAGLGVEFRGNVPLIDYPDARRIDINQTIRDTSEQVHVRIFNQKNPTTVYAVCDVSASMQFRGSNSKIALASEIAASIAYSAYQAGDRFSFIGFDHLVRKEWTTLPSTKMHDAFAMTEKLRAFKPLNRGSEGLVQVASHLAQTRGLVFLISDFHMPLEILEQALNTLSRHHVVPLVLWDSGEYRKLPRFGLSVIIDLETGEERTLFFREALRKKFAEAFYERRQQLKALFQRYESPACFVEDQFNPAAISEYFQQFSAL
jgi:uncharacterized protein (DUF58 family)